MAGQPLTLVAGVGPKRCALIGQDTETGEFRVSVLSSNPDTIAAAVEAVKEYLRTRDSQQCRKTSISN